MSQNQNETDADFPPQNDKETTEDYLKRLDQAYDDGDDKGDAAGNDKGANDKDGGADKAQEALPQDALPQDASPQKTATPERTLIPDEIRKKARIPEKFKYVEDLVGWGQQAERLIAKLGDEKFEKEKEAQIYKREFEKAQKSLQKQVADGEITKDDKDQQLEEFRLRFEIDPVGAIESLIEKRNAAAGTPASETSADNIDSSKDTGAPQYNPYAFQQAAAKAGQDLKELAAGKTKEEFLEYIRELKEVARQEPNITNLKSLNYILIAQKTERQKNLESQAAVKNKEKMQGSFPAGSSGAPIKREDVKSKSVEKASTMQELERLEAEMFE
ncbi:MAG: hypothetical protein LBU09_03260 [Endomicrobium sp.]|jgi:hypothetical protein|nr:hypothetical protein [Endomicrobium sp.]